MKILLSWLKDYVDLSKNPSIDATSDETLVRSLEEKLNNLGVEVEEVYQIGHNLNEIEIGKILAVKPHPNSDKLNLCTVEYSKGEIEVVCGASNVKPGLFIPYIGIDSKLPSNPQITISPRDIRGVVSEGMICSQEELCLPATIDGIFDLSMICDTENLNIGDSFANTFDTPDWVIEVSITSDRPDLMSVVGLARELGQLIDTPFPAIKYGSLDSQVELKIESEKVLAFDSVEAEVINTHSPWKIYYRLGACGVRLTNNVVDLTNYVMFDVGKPLHAFAADDSSSGAIQDSIVGVRGANKNEKIRTLDNKEVELTAGDLLIQNSQGDPVSIAGIMGGLNSEISNETKKILLESAVFDRASIAVTSKEKGLRSEASARFERGVDPNINFLGLERFLQLLDEQNALLKVGNVGKYLNDQLCIGVKPPKVSFSIAKLNKLIGKTYTTKEVLDVFQQLDIKVDQLDEVNFELTGPTHRFDLNIEVDYIEEIARCIGLDSVERTLPKKSSTPGSLPKNILIERKVRTYLASNGYVEILGPTLVNPELLIEEWGFDPSEIMQTINSVNKTNTALRNTTYTTLVETAKKNITLGLGKIEIFEISNVFSVEDTSAKLPVEENKLGILLWGTQKSAKADKSDVAKYDIYDLISHVSNLLGGLGIDYTLEVEEEIIKNFHPKRTLNVLVDSRKVGFITQEIKTENDFLIAEIDLDAITKIDSKATIFKPVSYLPLVRFDFTFICPKSVSVAQIKEVLRNNIDENIDFEKLLFLGEYQNEELYGEKLAKSFQVELRHQNKTLSEEDIAEIRSTLIKKLKDDLEVDFRNE